MPPGPALRRPVARLLVAAGLDEVVVRARGHRAPVDPERRQLDLVPLELVVVGPLVAGRAEEERPGLDEHLVAVGDRLVRGRRARRLRVRPARGAERDRLQHRLLVLELVLEHEAVDVAVREQAVVRVELDADEDAERPLAHAREVGDRGVRLEQRQLGAGGALVLEGVVEAVALLEQRLVPADVAREPELLEVADVRQVPDQRGHDRRVLADEVGARERCHEVEGAAPRVGEGLGERLLQLLLGSGTPGRRHCAQAYRPRAGPRRGRACG